MTTTVAVDLDGVVHAYSKGWYDGTIYDPIIPGAIDALRKLMQDHAVFIHTSREPEQVMPWLESHGFDVTIDERCGRCFGTGTEEYGEHPCKACEGREAIQFWNGRGQLLVTNRKLPASVYLDDRAVRFTNWTQALDDISLALKGPDPEFRETWRGGHALIVEYGDEVLIGRCQCGEPFTTIRPDQSTDRFTGMWERHTMGLGR